MTQNVIDPSQVSALEETGGLFTLAEPAPGPLDAAGSRYKRKGNGNRDAKGRKE